MKRSLDIALMVAILAAVAVALGTVAGFASGSANVWMVKIIGGTGTSSPTPADLGDGGPALKADMDPAAVALDAHGNIYISDPVANRVRKINGAGIITTIAGGGQNHNDNIKATSADLMGARGLVVDGKGDVFVSFGGYFGAQVSEITPDGLIKTVAGGQGALGKPSVQSGVPALSDPIIANGGALAGIAVDGQGNLFISERLAVVKVNPAGIETIVAGDPTKSGNPNHPTTGLFVNVTGMATDPQGNLYIVDQGSTFWKGATTAGGRVLKLRPGGKTSTFVPTGVLFPGIATDKQGHVYVTTAIPTSSFIGQLREFSSGGKLIATLAGGSPSFRKGAPALGNWIAPFGIALDKQGNILYTNQANVYQLYLAPGKARPAKPTKAAPKTVGTHTLKTVAVTLENHLALLASGRATLTSALTNAGNCSVTPAAAAGQMTSVVANRQRVLAQLSHLAAPTAQGTKIVTLLRQALTASLTADRDYQIWLRITQPSAGGCVLPHDQNYTAAQHADSQASAFKQRFTAAFNPVARSLGLRVWSASAF